MTEWCESVYKPFTAALLPTETKKTWTITYNYTKLVLHCNGVQIAEVVLSSACYYTGGGAVDWRTYWWKKPTQIWFAPYDTASDTYCFSSNPGKYNGVIESELKLVGDTFGECEAKFEKYISAF